VNIHLVSHRVARDPELRNHIRRRLQFALGRFAERIEHVRVTVTDVNGPRGGVDKRCSIHVHAPPLAPVIVEQTGPELGFTVDRAADRVGRTLARRLDRHAKARRRPPRAA